MSNNGGAEAITKYIHQGTESEKKDIRIENFKTDIKL